VITSSFFYQKLYANFLYLLSVFVYISSSKKIDKKAAEKNDGENCKMF